MGRLTPSAARNPLGAVTPPVIVEMEAEAVIYASGAATVDGSP